MYHLLLLPLCLLFIFNERPKKSQISQLQKILYFFKLLFFLLLMLYIWHVSNESEPNYSKWKHMRRKYPCYSNFHLEIACKIAEGADLSLLWTDSHHTKFTFPGRRFFFSVLFFRRFTCLSVIADSLPPSSKPPVMPPSGKQPFNFFYSVLWCRGKKWQESSGFSPVKCSASQSECFGVTISGGSSWFCYKVTVRYCVDYLTFLCHLIIETVVCNPLELLRGLNNYKKQFKKKQLVQSWA